MIVDCHTHINIGADDVEISEHLDAAEPVDVSIVLASGGASSEEANNKLSEYVGRHKEKMVGFAKLDPTKDGISIKNLESIRDKLGLEGVVLYCCSGGFHPTHSRAMRFYESAQEVGLPIFFHDTGDLKSDAVLDFAQPYLLDEIARTFEDLKIVIGGMGFPFVNQSLAMIAKHKNVYADLTVRTSNVWQIYNIVLSAYESGVMDKLFFGSGYPSGKAGECIETLLGFNKLLADTNLPTVPRGNIQSIIKCNVLELLGINR